MRNNLLILFLLGIGVQVFGQDAISEAYVQYEMTDVKSSDPQTDAMLQMMKGSTIEVYFNKEKQRMDMDMMGGMMKMSTFMNIGDDAANAMYMDMMGKKIKVNMSDEELKKYNSQAQQDFQKPVITPDYNDTKEISGFKCHKVKISYEENDDFDLVAYVTKDIKSPESVIQSASEVDLGGFPMEYMIENPQVNMTYSVKAFEKTVKADAFTPPVGYEAMTFEEFIQSMGAMGGGMGQ